MTNTVKRKILELCFKNNISVLDIMSIKSVALNLKMYDIIVYINNNTNEYISFAKNVNSNQNLGN